MFLMELPLSKRILHVGDFRAHPSMLKLPPLTRGRIDTLYLDTTYCKPAYKFPPQDQVMEFVVDTAHHYLKENARTLMVCGTYSIGKERVFRAIADALDCKVAVSPNKMKLLKCLSDDNLNARLTTDFKSASLHILTMNRLTIKVKRLSLIVIKKKFNRLKGNSHVHCFEYLSLVPTCAIYVRRGKFVALRSERLVFPLVKKYQRFHCVK